MEEVGKWVTTLQWRVREGFKNQINYFRGIFREGGGVFIFMSLLYFMFQSILNTFGFDYFFGGKKLIIFTDGGYPPPFPENSAKIINLIFEPFP